MLLLGWGVASAGCGGGGGAEEVEVLDLVFSAEVGDLVGSFGDQGYEGHGLAPSLWCLIQSS